VLVLFSQTTTVSRSRKKTPIRGNAAAASEKADKRQANRAVRRRVREALHDNADLEAPPVPRSVSDVWNMAKDGKHYIRDPRPKDLRK
jgi:hypothetical protein